VAAQPPGVRAARTAFKGEGQENSRLSAVDSFEC
jgi:hypothetical protein